VNGFTNDHHIHKKVDKTRPGETRCGFRLQQYSTATSCPSRHNSKYCSLHKFLVTCFLPHCNLRYPISWRQDLSCYMKMLSVTVPTQWFVLKMELGSSRTSTILIGYEPIWQLISESERPTAWHPLQDQKRYREGSGACDNWHINMKHCRWCQTSSTSVAACLQCGWRLRLRSVQRQL